MGVLTGDGWGTGGRREKPRLWPGYLLAALVFFGVIGLIVWAAHHPSRTFSVPGVVNGPVATGPLVPPASPASPASWA